MKEDRFLTIPNALTIFRIILVPFIAGAYDPEHGNIRMIGLLLLSGSTDVLDGYAARKLNMVSSWGKALDPIADKITQAAVMICLCRHFPAIILPLGLLLVKECVSGIFSAAVICRTGFVESADRHGKITAVFIYGMLILHLLFPEIPELVSFFVILLTSVFMLISFLLYMRVHLNNLKEEKREDLACKNKEKKL